MKLQDLKRGMRCTYRDESVFTVDRVDSEGIHYLFDKKGIWNVSLTQEDLTNERFRDLDIVKVEDITRNGYETIWEREEKKYYLRMPNFWRFSRNYLNYNIYDKSYLFGAVDEGPCWKSQFTQEEITNLPRQDFIKTLIKEEVK